MKFDKVVLDLIEANEQQPITPVWVVSQHFLPDTVVDVVRLEHERKAKRFNSMEDAMRHLLVGHAIVIPDPANPKMLKIQHAEWDTT